MDENRENNRSIINKVRDLDHKTDEFSLMIAKIAIPIAIVYLIYRLIF